jgi:hypothetical protein
VAYLKVVVHYFHVTAEVNHLRPKAKSVPSFAVKKRENSMGNATGRSRPVARRVLLVVLSSV